MTWVLMSGVSSGDDSSPLEFWCPYYTPFVEKYPSQMRKDEPNPHQRFWYFTHCNACVMDYRDSRWRTEFQCRKYGGSHHLPTRQQTKAMFSHLHKVFIDESKTNRRASSCAHREKGANPLHGLKLSCVSEGAQRTVHI